MLYAIPALFPRLDLCKFHKTYGIRYIRRSLSFSRDLVPMFFGKYSDIRDLGPRRGDHLIPNVLFRYTTELDILWQQPAEMLDGRRKWDRTDSR